MATTATATPEQLSTRRRGSHQGELHARPIGPDRGLIELPSQVCRRKRRRPPAEDPPPQKHRTFAQATEQGRCWCTRTIPDRTVRSPDQRGVSDRAAKFINERQRLTVLVGDAVDVRAHGAFHHVHEGIALAGAPLAPAWRQPNRGVLGGAAYQCGLHGSRAEGAPA